MKKLVILFTILIIPPFSFAEEKMVVRFTEPYKVILSEFLTEIYDIAAYKPGMFLDIVINRNEYEDLLRRGFDVQITQTEAQLKKILK